MRRYALRDDQWDRIKIGFLLVFIALCVLAGAYGLVMLGMLAINVSATAGWIFLRIGETVIFLGVIAAIATLTRYCSPLA